METVGFIGMGKMGTPMAVNMQKAGYPMVVYDAREEATRPLLDGGARLAESAAELAQLAMWSLPAYRGLKLSNKWSKAPKGY